MAKYRIIEEKYPSYSLWIPEHNYNVTWVAFTQSGRPHDRLVLSSRYEAEFHINQDKRRVEFENEIPEIIYHEIN